MSWSWHSQDDGVYDKEREVKSLVSRSLASCIDFTGEINDNRKTGKKGTSNRKIMSGRARKFLFPDVLDNSFKTLEGRYAYRARYVVLIDPWEYSRR